MRASNAPVKTWMLVLPAREDGARNDGDFLHGQSTVTLLANIAP
jgi:hypothetical protein